MRYSGLAASRGLTNNIDTVRSMEQIRSRENGASLTGQSPELHAEIKKKFLAAHAILNALTKNDALTLQILLINKKRMHIEQSNT